MSLFPFVQFELAGALGIADGRYPVRRASGEAATTEAVLVARTFGAPTSPRWRRARPRDSDPDQQPTVPVTQLTVIDTNALAGDPAAWLTDLRRDRDRRHELVETGLWHARRAVAARRVAAGESALPDPSLDLALTVRIGYGMGDELVEGDYRDALDIPRDDSRRGRAAAMRPHERMAAILGGRERALVCEELILRARSDFDGGRVREATLQVRVGLEALLAERDAFESAEQAQDIEFLSSRRKVTGEAANEALRADLGPARETEVAETLAVCERVLRRRALLG